MKAKGGVNMGRLTDYLPITASQQALRLDDILGQEVTVVDFRLATGSYGEYAFVDVGVPDRGTVSVMTGAAFVISALKAAKAANALPIPAKFVKRGRTWIVE